MENFQPLQASLLSRILWHPALHVSAIVILVLIAVTYIKVKDRQKQSFLAQVEQMQNSPLVLEKSQAPAQSQAAESQPSIAPTPEATATPEESKENNLVATNANTDSASRNFMAASKSGAKNVVVTASAAVLDSAAVGGGSAAAENENSNDTKAIPKNPLKVRVFYAEVPVAAIDRWSARMQSTGQFQSTDFRMGVLPNIEQEINADRSIVILDRIEKRFDKGDTVEWSVGRTSREQFAGLKTNLTLTLTERETFRGEVKVIRQIETTDPRTFEADFEAPPKAGWVFTDLLPHQFRLDPEDEMNPKSIFKIFNSPRFKNLTTQFTLLFVFDRN